MKRSYYRGQDFRRAVSIDELRALAERRVLRMAFEYLNGGAEDEVTLRRNREEPRRDLSIIARCAMIKISSS
jgi:(S)-mandelate dehydrogenase